MALRREASEETEEPFQPAIKRFQTDDICDLSSSFSLLYISDPPKAAAPKHDIAEYGAKVDEPASKRPSIDEGRDMSRKKTSVSLLNLPAELRNQIYELALIEPMKQVTVTSDLKPPGLLAANRQIRSECRKIWYFENRFLFPIFNCDAKLKGQFMKVIMTVVTKDGPSVETANLIHGRGARWGNLLDWCRVVQKYGCGLLPMPENLKDNDYMTVVVAAHQIAIAHAGGRGSWEMCLRNLQALRMVAGRVNNEWLKD
ncbi:hypothetical protein PRZ48_004754 [Zasmidium cellare]|uniref:F-box domain-containing protein n=1 Tax=Zasmidium cellare TaxID=395010 RepID=A0ABR0EQF0_ZASCE|nr:hypothetical protein PRZ48_004754 [Zasmidium cellare]